MGRSAGGFRLYDRGAVWRIHLIQSLQELQLNLRDIKTLMALKDEKETRGELATNLISKLKDHFTEAERKQAIYQAIVRDFDAGMKILSECQDCTRAPNEPHCGKHRIFLTEDLLPLVLRSLF
jgi:DNA-binding transcriptional MerR regulator